jgi:hypothetical protein
MSNNHCVALGSFLIIKHSTIKSSDKAETLAVILHSSKECLQEFIAPQIEHELE